MGRINGFVSIDDESLLQFLREQLPQIREGKAICTLTGGYSTIVACIRPEGGRVLAANLFPNMPQSGHKEDTFLPRPQ